MTQDPRQFPNPYPSPYPGPDPGAMGYSGFAPGFDPYATLKIPAKRAGLMMIIVGAFSLVCGGCGSFGAWMILHPPTGPEWASFNEQRAKWLAQFQASGSSPHDTLVMAAVTLVIGLLLLILGFLVRRGGKSVVRIALGFNGLLCIVTALFFLRDALAIISTRQFQYIPVLIAPAIPLVLFGIIVMLLIQAIRNSSQLGSAENLYQQQLLQYQQQHQMYAQGMYPAQGYGAPPPPSAFQPPPPPPPQQPPTNPPGGGGM